MNERGIISYFNVFIVFFVSLILMIDLMDTLVSNKNNEYIYEVAQSIDYMENNVNLFFIKLLEYEEVPKKVVYSGLKSATIEVVDEKNKIYKTYLFNRFELVLLGNYSTIYVTFKRESSGYKIIKMEMCDG